ncbi:MAG: DUF4367 domain-containing protein [Oscillospiraceae bacterium]|nr:DUF4367 domain-containing protein [Oscillospiraceae bacterium]
MNEFEQMLAGALAQNADEQYGEFFDADIKHRFSRSYKRQRRKTVLSAEKTRRGVRIPPAEGISIPKMTGIPFKKRVTIISIAIMMAIGVSAGAGASLAVGFKKTEETVIDFTLMVADPQNSPQSIEYVYYLPEIPEGYYLDNVDYDLLFDVQYFYEREDGESSIYFSQHRRQDYISFDNEHIISSEEVMVGDKYGVFMVWERTANLLWDNGDYVLLISGGLTKEEAINLAKSAKVCGIEDFFEKIA